MVWRVLRKAIIAVICWNFLVLGDDVIESFLPKSEYPRELNNWLKMVQKHKEDFRLIRQAVDEQSPHKRNYLKLYMDDGNDDEAPQNDIYPHMYETKKKQSSYMSSPARLESSRSLRLTSNLARNPLRLRRESNVPEYFEKKANVEIQPKSQSGEIKRSEMKYPERFARHNERAEENADKKRKREIQIDVLNDGKLIKQIREDDRNSKSIVLNIESVDDNKRNSDKKEILDIESPIKNRGAVLEAPLKLEVSPSPQFKDKESLNNFRNLFTENEHLNTDINLARENVIKSGLEYHVTIPNFETMHDATSNYPPRLEVEGNEEELTNANKDNFNRNGLQDMSKFWSPTEKTLLQTGIKLAQGNGNLDQLEHESKQKPSPDGFEVVKSMIIESGNGKEQPRERKKSTSREGRISNRYPNKRQLNFANKVLVDEINIKDLFTTSNNVADRLENIDPIDVIGVSNEIPRDLYSETEVTLLLPTQANYGASTDNDLFFGSLDIQKQGLGTISGHYAVNADKHDPDILEDSVPHNHDADSDKDIIITNSDKEDDLFIVPLNNIEHNKKTGKIHKSVKKVDKVMYGHQVITVVETVTIITTNNALLSNEALESKTNQLNQDTQDQHFQEIHEQTHHRTPTSTQLYVEETFHPQHRHDPEDTIEKDENHDESFHDHDHRIESQENEILDSQVAEHRHNVDKGNNKEEGTEDVRELETQERHLHPTPTDEESELDTDDNNIKSVLNDEDTDNNYEDINSQNDVNNNEENQDEEDKYIEIKYTHVFTERNPYNEKSQDGDILNQDDISEPGDEYTEDNEENKPQPDVPSNNRHENRSGDRIVHNENQQNDILKQLIPRNDECNENTGKMEISKCDEEMCEDTRHHYADDNLSSRPEIFNNDNYKDLRKQEDNEGTNDSSKSQKVAVLVFNENSRNKHNLNGHLHPKIKDHTVRMERKSKKPWIHKQQHHDGKRKVPRRKYEKFSRKHRRDRSDMNKKHNKKLQNYYKRHHPERQNKKKYHQNKYSQNMHKTDSSKSRDAIPRYFKRQLKAAADYIYDASLDNAKDDYDAMKENPSETTTLKIQVKGLIHKNSVEGDYGDEEDSISEKRSRDRLLPVKESENIYAHPVTTAEYDEDDYEDEIEEKPQYANEKTGKSKHAVRRVHINDDKVEFGRRLHKKIKSPATKNSISRKSFRDPRSFLNNRDLDNSEFSHWPKFVISDQENEDILRKRSLNVKKKQSQKNNFPKATNDFFVRQAIQRKRNNKKRSDTLSSQITDTTQSIIDLPKIGDNSVDDILGEHTSETTLNPSFPDLSSIEFTRSTTVNETEEECTPEDHDACNEDSTSSRPPLLTVLPIVRDAETEAVNQSAIEEPEVFERLDEIINGELPKKLVNEVMSEMKKNNSLKKQLFRGLTNKHKEINPNATDTNSIQSKKLLNLMSRIMEKLQFTTTCQVLPPLLRAYLRDTTRVNKEEALSRAKEMNEIDLDDHQNDKNNNNYIFRSSAPGEMLEDKLTMLQTLLDKYNSLPDYCKHRATPVKEYIENHIGMLNSMLSVNDQENNSTRKTSKEIKRQGQIEEKPDELVEQQLESVGLGKKNNFKPKFSLDDMISLNRVSKSVEKKNQKVVSKRDLQRPSQSYNRLEDAVLKEKMRKKKENTLGEIYGALNEDYYNDDASQSKGDRKMNFETPLVYSL